MTDPCFPTLDGPAGQSFRRPSTPPRSTRTSETAQHSADVAPGCAAEPQVEQAEPPEVKASQTGSKAIRLCAKCGARLSPRSRAHRVYCSHTCRGRASKLRALEQETDRPALPRVARARLAELREGRKPTPVTYPREDGRR